jgi:SAM-dependent methyltransferase
MGAHLRADVQDEMDLRLRDRLQTVDWSAKQFVLDPASDTGQIRTWLRHRGSAAIDGVDVTPEMVEVARTNGVYRTLRLADVANPASPAKSYELCVQSLADEHLPDLGLLYREVARVTTRGGDFVIRRVPSS